MKSNEAAEESPAKGSAYTEEAGRNPRQSRVGASSSTSTKSSLIGEEQKLIEQMIERDNLNAAWRQWKRPRTRFQRLKAAGLDKERARKSAVNGRGAWFSSGASHMNAAFPKRYFDKVGLRSLLDMLQSFTTTSP